jgi:Ulp1 family protease
VSGISRDLDSNTDLIVCPVVREESHWVLVTVDFRVRQIGFYTSLQQRREDVVHDSIDVLSHFAMWMNEAALFITS